MIDEHEHLAGGVAGFGEEQAAAVAVGEQSRGDDDVVPQRLGGDELSGLGEGGGVVAEEA